MLFKRGIIGPNLLKATAGLYENESKEFGKTKKFANQFSHHLKFGHIYPLFKGVFRNM